MEMEYDIADEKISTLSKYIAGNMVNVSLIWYLISGIKGENVNFILEKEAIMAIKMAAISNLLLFSKEEMIEKNGMKVASKLFDIELKQTVDRIASLRDGKYYIDNFSFSSAEEVVTFIRNKLAHGSFCSDFEHGNVILIDGDNRVSININRLGKFVVSAFSSVLCLTEKNVYKRDKVISTRVRKRKTELITDIEYMKKVIMKFSEICITCVERNGMKVASEVRDVIDKLVEKYDTTIGWYNDFEQIKEKYKMDYDISFKLNKLDDGRASELADFLISKVNSSFNYDYQISQILAFLPRIFNSYYNRLIPMAMNIKIIELADEIFKNGIRNRDILINKITSLEHYDLVLSDDFLAMAAINMFISIFAYGFDKLYENDNLWTDLDNTGLDYGKLDLSVIRVKTGNLKIPEIDELRVQLDSRFARDNKYNERLKSFSLNLEKVTDKSVVEKIKKNVMQVKEDKECNMKQIKILDEEYKTKKNYFDNNQKYFRNRQIIEGIRNAISHGNYSVVYAGGDSKIVFKDIYHGNITFIGEVDTYDFVDMLIRMFPILTDFFKMKSEGKVIVK